MMDADTRRRLAALPRLGAGGGAAVACKVCGAPSPPFDVVDFNKLCSSDRPYLFGLSGIPVVYHRCPQCGFLFTVFFDDWDEADFAAFVYNEDYIKVDGDYVDRRPRADAAGVLALLDGRRDLSVLDYGGGTGILAAVLREAGVDAVSYDPFSDPVRPDRRFDLVTCFEVIEHSPDPAATMADLARTMAEDGCVLIGTALQPPEIADLRGGWWYVGPRNGHVSIHSARSLSELARGAGLTLIHGGGFKALVPPSPAAASRAIVAALGTPAVSLDLVAPGIAGRAQALIADPAPWHGVEGTDRRFRWTGEQKVGWTWTPPMLGVAEITVRLPLVMEVEPDFAARSYLRIAGDKVRPVREGDGLVARLSLALDGPVRIILVTPPPLRPADLRGDADSRRLGLAVAIGA